MYLVNPTAEARLNDGPNGKFTVAVQKIMRLVGAVLR